MCGHLSQLHLLQDVQMVGHSTLKLAHAHLMSVWSDSLSLIYVGREDQNPA